MTDQERKGWHFLAMGASQALRNADTHRIQKRKDHKPYAMGVLGTCSVLLSQMRHENANRLHDDSPIESLLDESD